MKLIALVFILVLTIPNIGKAKVFSNSYIQFELPNQWRCQMKNLAYLCRHKISRSCKKDPSSETCKKEIHLSREAVIVMAAKERSEVDSFQNYKNYFGESRVLTMPNGNSSQSKVVHSKKVNIKKQPWLDTMHLGSELPKYYTRYLVTVKDNLAVLVTFTAHKKYYTKYSGPLFRSIKSLQITASELSKINKKELGPKVLSRPIDLPEDMLNGMGAEPASDDGSSNLLFGLAMILMAAGIYIWIKSRKSS